MGSTLVGSTLGRFRVDRLLGRGGMGAVYAAFDEKLERDVALKVLIEEGENVALQTKRLMREARLAAKLTHPNIATVYEVDEIDGRLVIVMELLDGHPLRKILTQRKMEMEEAIAIGRDMARALSRAHAAGVIHRDIKPENVFVTTPSPETILAKVLDFGLARQKPTDIPGTEHTSVTNTTSQGNMWGTPGYVSPEQAHGQIVDVRTDIFSFGVVFYEMLANIKPFRGDTAIQLMIATTRVEARPLREIVPALAPEVEEIIRRCMRKNKEERYADGGELSSALEGFFRGTASAKMGTSSGVVSSSRLPILGPDDLKAAEANGSQPEGSHSPTTGGTAAIEITARDHDIHSYEQQRRDRMKLLIAIASGIGVAIVVVIIALWTSSRRRPSDVDQGQTAAASGGTTTTTPPPTMAVEPPPPPPSEIVVPPPSAAASAVETTPPPPPPPATTTAATVAATAPPTPPTPTPTPTHAGSAHHPKPPPKKRDCLQPFITDSKGVKIPKMECL